MALERIARELHVELREEVPIDEFPKDLFSCDRDYDHYVRLAKRLHSTSLYVYIGANGDTGEVRVEGISVIPDGHLKGRVYNPVGKGDLPFLLKRMDQIRTHFNMPDLYAKARYG